MSSKPSPVEQVYLRNYLGDVPGNGQPKSVAFSPDIIPSFGNKVSVSTLATTYSNFVSLPLVPYDVNNIYVRGIVADTTQAGEVSAAFNMLAVPSEMILWPQVWNKSLPTAPGPIVVQTTSNSEHVGTEVPFTVRLSDLGGVNYALIAVQSPVPTELPQQIRFKDALSPFSKDVGNWRDYYDWISTDKSTTFYNTVVADPTSPVISITTRLRMFEDDSSITSVDVMLLFEHVGLDPQTEVSIVSDVGSITLGRTPLGTDTGTVGIHTSLPSNYDGLVTFNIFPKKTIPDMSWVALQISTLKDDSDDSGISTEYILGAQNVVFASDATRNARFLSPAAVQLTASATKEPSPVAKTQTVALGDGDGIPATGWWFRDVINDINSFPRVIGILSHSPDIQPVGTVPDSNAVADLSGANFNIDYTNAKGVQLVGGAPNFVNLRGNCTLGSYQVETRLFCVPCNIIITPGQYGPLSVNDYDGNGDSIGPAIRSITTVNADDFNVLGNPFNILNPADPKTLGSDHYCLIAETRHKTTFLPDPQWPHEIAGDFATGDDFNAWVAGTPNVCWRNISYTTDGGGATSVYPTTMTIPADKYGPTTTWLLTVSGTNVPIGSAWALTAAGDPIPGININFLKTVITSNIMTQGVHFTGLPSKGYNAQLTLQWWSNGQTPVQANGGGMLFTYTLLAVAPSLMAPSNRFGGPLPEAASSWPLCVGIHHPGLKYHGNTKGLQALVPQFENHGRQSQTHKTGRLLTVVPSNGTSLGGDTFIVTKAL